MMVSVTYDVYDVNGDGYSGGSGGGGDFVRHLWFVEVMV